jgi:hypothetical protein
VRQPGFWPYVLPLPWLLLVFCLHFQGRLALAQVLLPSGIPLSIVTIWGLLVGTRQWRAEPSWVDRAGRVIGVGWIATALPALWGYVFR